MKQCLVAVGSNIGNCREHIEKALSHIDSIEKTSVVKVSDWLETAPVGSRTDRVFLNGAILVETQRTPQQLMNDLLKIEAKGGRDRSGGSGNRPIDLDILLYEDQVIDDSYLQIPHPRMTFRRFVLGPASRIAGEYQHPIAGCDLQTLYSQLQRKRNLIVVHTDSQRQLSELQKAAEDTSGKHIAHEVTWCFAQNPKAILAAMREALWTPRHWCVLASFSPHELPSQWFESAKLNVFLTEKRGQREDSAGLYPTIEGLGTPYWCLQPLHAEQIMDGIDTAIQSMLPLES